MKTLPDSPLFVYDPQWVINSDPQPGVESCTVSFNRPVLYGEVEGLPEPQPGVLYIVSMLVAQRVMRADVVSPDSGPTAIRENGQIVAVRALNRHV